MRRRILIALLLAAIPSQVFAQSLWGSATWRNQRGSEATFFAADAAGNFRGFYINNATGFDCRGTPYPISGRTAGGNVTFVVKWSNLFRDCNSVTTWRGRIRGTTMQTRWELAYTDAGTGRPAILRGRDTFTRLP